MKFQCPRCGLRRDAQFASRTIRRIGTYFRKPDGQRLSRFWCFRCKKSFSAATTSPLRGQKKRHLNRMVITLLNGHVSQREAARILRINPKTVVRKFRFAGSRAKDELMRKNVDCAKATEVEFDDLETFEHTHCKPLSVTLMVEKRSRRILGFEVAQMPAKGRLANISRKKYGPRSDLRSYARAKLFSEVRDLISPNAQIWSDSNPHYTNDVKMFFPDASHFTVLGGRSSITGQGELKRKKFDPIFSLNHTCAMTRAHLNRLIRKTWCTTKKSSQLSLHLAIYALEHNRRLSTA
ncbi:MAG: transposase [Bdellovibrionales bacterium]|nr:transposase [Bdellovibrionales bacterium]